MPLYIACEQGHWPSGQDMSSRDPSTHSRAWFLQTETAHDTDVCFFVLASGIVKPKNSLILAGIWYAQNKYNVIWWMAPHWFLMLFRFLSFGSLNLLFQRFAFIVFSWQTFIQASLTFTIAFLMLFWRPFFFLLGQSDPVSKKIRATET